MCSKDFSYTYPVCDIQCGRLLIHLLFYIHTVPPPNVTILPSGPIQGAMVGSPEVINCTITEVSGVAPDSGIIIWIGPNGEVINNSRTMIMEAYNSDDNTYTSSLQFTYLMEGDNDTYTCNFMAGEIIVSQSVELPLTSKLSFTYQLATVYSSVCRKSLVI